VRKIRSAKHKKKKAEAVLVGKIKKNLKNTKQTGISFPNVCVCLGAESPAATICLQMTLKVRIYFNSYAAKAVACPRHSVCGPTCVKTNEAFSCESGSTI